MLNKCQLINEDDMVKCFPHITPTPPNTVSEIKSRSENNNNILKHCFTGSLNVNPLLCSSQSILFLIKYQLPRMFNALFMCLFKPLPFSHVFFYSSLSSVVLRVIFHAPVRSVCMCISFQFLPWGLPFRVIHQSPFPGFYQ